MTPAEVYREERRRRRIRIAKARRRVATVDSEWCPPPSAFPTRKEYDRAYYLANRSRKLAAANARNRALRRSDV